MNRRRPPLERLDLRGCYGFRVTGVPARPRSPRRRARQLAHALAAHTSGPAEAPPRRTSSDPSVRALTMHGGWIAIERSPSRATFHVPTPPPDRDLVHPYLAPAAAVAARWAGRESFHAGRGDPRRRRVGDPRRQGEREEHDARLDGARRAGPCSRTTCWWSTGMERSPVLAASTCGEPSAERLGAGDPLGVVGVRERWRVGLGPVPRAVPLRGWITLAWDDEIGVDAATAARSGCSRLMPFRSVRVAPERPERLIELSSLPVLRLRRPRRWEALPEAGGRLLDAIAG